jgi:hypothetical protein
LYVMDVGGWEVRCRIDFAELLDDGAAGHVEDYKSGRGAVPFEEVARKRPDGTLMAKNFQLVLYPLALVYGVPVREETCGNCLGIDPDSCMSGCHRGVIETREPFSVASRAQRFDCEFVYPGIEDREGKMVRRPVSLTRTELEAYRGSLEALLTQLDYRVESGDWPAVASDPACDICPARRLCPIPVELNDHRGRINDPVECADALERHDVVGREQRAVGSEIRAFVKANGAVVYGGGMVAELGHRVSVEIRDKDGMFDALERSRLYGEPFERGRWVREKESFPLVKRALSPDELAALAAEEDGHGSQEDGGGDERLDERFGADAPF